MSDKTDTSGTDSGHVRNASATERLSALLDERGVEHFDGTETTLWGYEQTSDSTGMYRYAADETSDGFVNVRLHHLTPEQAVEATLGPGTCHDVSRTHGRWTCSECVVTAERTEIAGDYSDRRTARLDGIATREVLEAFLHMAEGVLS